MIGRKSISAILKFSIVKNTISSYVKLNLERCQLAQIVGRHFCQTVCMHVKLVNIIMHVMTPQFELVSNTIFRVSNLPATTSALGFWARLLGNTSD